MLWRQNAKIRTHSNPDVRGVCRTLGYILNHFFHVPHVARGVATNVFSNHVA